MGHLLDIVCILHCNENEDRTDDEDIDYKVDGISWFLCFRQKLFEFIKWFEYKSFCCVFFVSFVSNEIQISVNQLSSFVVDELNKCTAAKPFEIFDWCVDWNIIKKYV